MKIFFKKFFWILSEKLNLGDIKRQASITNDILVDDYLQRNLYNNPKYADPKKLNKYEYRVFSQNGEDGIISEIFKRIGATNRFFVEFGVGVGNENNTVNLLTKDWQGCWIEGGETYIESIERAYEHVIKNGKLKVKKALVNAENVETLFDELKVPEELDFLSIDIDGNDYWVWKALKKYRPRTLVIEMNGLFRPDQKLVMEYIPNNEWNRTSYYGASLKSLELLGAEKGYKLVGCNFTGVNAFFVREDLVRDKFLEPFTAENHYEPKKIWLIRQSGDRRSFGKFLNI